MMRCTRSVLGVISSLHPEWTMSLEAEKRYYESQEDHTPQMLEFIERHKDEYAAFLFMNFYFSQPVLGSTIAPEKTILIPLVHPDKPLYYSINAPMFTRVRHIAFNTAAERQLCRRAFGASLAPNSLVGCGIEEAPEADWGEKNYYGLFNTELVYNGVLPEKHFLIERIKIWNVNQIYEDYLMSGIKGLNEYFAAWKKYGIGDSIYI